MNTSFERSENYDLAQYQVLKRDGQIAFFDINKINTAITKAYISVHQEKILSASIRQQIINLTDITGQSLQNIHPYGAVIHIDEIQDQVELSLMRNGEYEVARAYVIYREKRHARSVYKSQHNLFNTELHDLIDSILDHSIKNIDIEKLINAAAVNLYEGASESEQLEALILASRQMIETEPNYSYVAAYILLHVLRKEVIGVFVSQSDFNKDYGKYFIDYIQIGVDTKVLDTRLKDFDLQELANSIVGERDCKFKYMGIKTLYDRYFIRYRNKRLELPQFLFMRVAMGLAINNKNLQSKDTTDEVISFYSLLSSFDFMSSTPTLFNAGTIHQQLSSCYLSTIDDSLVGIYDGIKNNALLSKYAGGWGNDWTPVRSLGSYINGTHGLSQGVIPFLKVVNDSCVAVNQGGRRRGSACVYLETWHADIEEFLELRKNTGDDRRRTHDLHLANWIPDLFMKRVINNEEWHLFSPDEVPELHELYGKAFEDKYCYYEELGKNNKLFIFKKVEAVTLWRKMLSMLFETGHPWICFKDPCNIRSPQQHCGVVHSSNLCTEITLNTSEEEIAVCNLGSINLVNHLDGKSLDVIKLQHTIKIAMKMLDNVIDINFYPVEKAKNSNQKNRPVGLGVMGFQDCLHIMGIQYDSQEAVEFDYVSMENISYYAYLSSSQMAKEFGSYSTYSGSLWSKGILPLDSFEILKNERGAEYLTYNTDSTLDWEYLRQFILTNGMRNSNCVAIAPTATIANIVGVSNSIEPMFQNLYSKTNLSGDFTVINEYLINDLKELDLWDEVMISDIKFFDGRVDQIERIPSKLRNIYKTAFEIASKWLILAASRRAKWIDQSQSLNIYLATTSGRVLHDTYISAFLNGLKTTYYLRSLSASAVEKSTGTGTDVMMLNHDGSVNYNHNDKKYCMIDNSCESCQ